MQIKCFHFELGPAHAHSWNELAESSLEPCGAPRGSKGSPRPGGRTLAGADASEADAEGRIQKDSRGG